jgi:hypothetical protein
MVIMDIYNVVRLILGIVVILAIPLAYYSDKKKNNKINIFMAFVLFILGISSILLAFS